MSGNSETVSTTMTVIVYKYNIVAIVIGSVMEILEASLLFVVISSSWKSYRGNRRNYSFLGFLKSIPIMKKCFLVSGIVIFSYNTLFVVTEIFPPQDRKYWCIMNFFILGGLRFNMCSATVYVYLWARQYRLNSSPVLRTVIPKWFYMLSKTSLTLTILGFVVPMVLSYEGFIRSPEDLKASSRTYFINGECYAPPARNPVLTYTALGLVLLIQFSYCFLFYKTLRFHQEANRNASNENTQRLTMISKRCLQTTTVTVTTDLAATFINLYLRMFPVSYLVLFSHLDLMVNMFAMILSFNSLPSIGILLMKFATCGRYNDNVDAVPRPQQMAQRNANAAAPNPNI